VPAAVHDDAPAIPKSLRIGVTHIMNTLHGIAAALAEIKIEHIPKRLIPHIGADGENVGKEFPIADAVLPGFPETLIKVVVDTVLFFISYYLQRKLIF
jgi:hypothetical protein